MKSLLYLVPVLMFSCAHPVPATTDKHQTTTPVLKCDSGILLKIYSSNRPELAIQGNKFFSCYVNDKGDLVIQGHPIKDET